MARIRSVHPGLWTDESFVGVSMAARLLFIGIWNEADDQGAFAWKPVSLKMRLLPADNVDVPALLSELVGADMVRRYEVGGKQFGAVRNFTRFQRPKKPNSVHPMPAEFRTYAGSSASSSELAGDEGQGGSEPEDFERAGSSPPVPHQFGTSGGKSPQMEDGGWMREEIPPSPPSEARAPRGTRLPDDWQPSSADRDSARTLGLNADAVAATFRDYWHSKPGKDGVKLDWSATWRIWCRKEAERRPHRGQRQAEGPKFHNGFAGAAYGDLLAAERAPPPLQCSPATLIEGVADASE